MDFYLAYLICSTLVILGLIAHIVLIMRANDKLRRDCLDLAMDLAIKKASEKGDYETARFMATAKRTRPPEKIKTPSAGAKEEEPKTGLLITQSG